MFLNTNCQYPRRRERRVSSFEQPHPYFIADRQDGRPIVAVVEGAVEFPLPRASSVSTEKAGNGSVRDSSFGPGRVTKFCRVLPGSAATKFYSGQQTRIASCRTAAVLKLSDLLIRVWDRPYSKGLVFTALSNTLK